MLIATHSENDVMIKTNLEIHKTQYGEDIPVSYHPRIRAAEACYDATKKVVALTKKYGSKLHVLNISTFHEVDLFDNSIPLEQKRITAEACIHHLWFSDEDYKKKGNFFKWNPAIKKAQDRERILEGVLEDRIDVIATGHAPHTLEEKTRKYESAPIMRILDSA